ncbi:hypothetical protein DAD186_16420 [Dermabacter vaginalis]|uniref:Uncharacterized protein n=1 Tax=Dermabacter vaginalis TaxID=1630135 RepID=A0A1B0ZK08_9MICO|nr:hypothetical protein DAD186_16420 [Dermabacter vaginalis]
MREVPEDEPREVPFDARAGEVVRVAMFSIYPAKGTIVTRSAPACESHGGSIS